MLALTVGFVGFVISNGLDHITLHVLTHESAITSDDSRLMALSIGTAKAGVVIVSASGVFFGTMLLALGLAMTLPAGFQRTAAQAMSALALAGLGVHIMAEHVHTDTLYAISGMSTVVVALWYVTLGVSIMRTKGEPEGAAHPAAGYST